MAYKRKTKDEFQIHQYFVESGIWEEVSACSTRREAKEELKEYRENQPQYPVRIVKKRVSITVE